MKNFIDYYYQYRDECKLKGECFYKYFEDMHMHCNAGAGKYFEFVSPAEERLNYIQSNYEKLIKNENILNNLNEILLQTISNEPRYITI
mgnify:CR=1 FL=1